MGRLQGYREVMTNVGKVISKPTGAVGPPEMQIEREGCLPFSDTVTSVLPLIHCSNCCYMADFRTFCSANMRRWQRRLTFVNDWCWLWGIIFSLVLYTPWMGPMCCHCILGVCWRGLQFLCVWMNSLGF